MGSVMDCSPSNYFFPGLNFGTSGQILSSTFTRVISNASITRLHLAQVVLRRGAACLDGFSEP